MATVMSIVLFLLCYMIHKQYKVFLSTGRCFPVFVDHFPELLKYCLKFYNNMFQSFYIHILMQLYTLKKVEFYSLGLVLFLIQNYNCLIQKLCTKLIN